MSILVFFTFFAAILTNQSEVSVLISILYFMYVCMTVRMQRLNGESDFDEI